MTTQPEVPQTRDDAGVWLVGSVHSELSPEQVDIDVVFRRQPRPVIARHRLAYRTSLAVLVLSRFNRGAAKLTNLHTLMWATRTQRTRQMFGSWWAGRRFYFTNTERIDPDLQITLNLAIVDGLIEPGSNQARVALTEKGRDLARLIDADEDLLRTDKVFLAQLGTLSDALMERRLEAVQR